MNRYLLEPSENGWYIIDIKTQTIMETGSKADFTLLDHVALRMSEWARKQARKRSHKR